MLCIHVFYVNKHLTRLPLSVLHRAQLVTDTLTFVPQSKKILTFALNCKYGVMLAVGHVFNRFNLFEK